jgi:ribosomal protein S18 acetylase RimI-like enzyme
MQFQVEEELNWMASKNYEKLGFENQKYFEMA